MMHTRLLAVLAHPDDESFLMGGTLARYAAEGVDVVVVTATRGEAGQGDPDPKRNGQRRERELREAVAVLGVKALQVLGYPDGRLAQVPRPLLVRRVLDSIQAWAAGVVLTFGPDGISGHADHVTIGEVTREAVMSVEAKVGLFQVVPSPATRQCCRRGAGAFDATGLTAVDITAYRVLKVRAMQCHRSQPQPFLGEPETIAGQLIDHEYFRLAWPPVGAFPPTDLFDAPGRPSR